VLCARDVVHAEASDSYLQLFVTNNGVQTLVALGSLLLSHTVAL
jgi:hypothetical protein